MIMTFHCCLTHHIKSRNSLDSADLKDSIDEEMTIRNHAPKWVRMSVWVWECNKKKKKRLNSRKLTASNCSLIFLALPRYREWSKYFFMRANSLKNLLPQHCWNYIEIMKNLPFIFILSFISMMTTISWFLLLLFLEVTDNDKLLNEQHNKWVN